MAKKRPADVPGNAVASAQAVTQYWYDVGLALGALDKYRDAPGHDAPALLGLSIKCDPGDELGILVVARGMSEDGYVVAFHRDETILDAVVGMSRRLRNHTAKWKEDEYAKRDAERRKRG